MLRQFFFLFLSLPVFSTAQDNDKQFVNHLLKNGFYTETEYFITHLESERSQAPGLTYALAICYKKQEQSLLFEQSLVKLKTGGPYYFHSNLLLQHFYLQNNKLAEAERCFFSNTSCPDSLAKIQNLNFALFYALKRDSTGFGSAKKNAINDNSPYVSSINEMETALKKIMAYKKKKPFVGGMLSALVPGLGKAYARKPRQGFTTFFTVAVFGLQTLEMYRHGGFKNPGFYIYGSLFTTFYLGNILGGAHAVKKHNHDYIKEQENALFEQANYPYSAAGF